jgi:hypothetical protein
MSTKSKKKQETKLLWRVLITLVGAALICIAVSHLALYFFGETAPVSVATRRFGGSNDGRPSNQRYEWALDYTFYDKNGTARSGHTTRRGSDFSVQTDSRVYYFSLAPFISTLESEAKPNAGQLVCIVLGVFLIVIMNRKKANKRRSPTVRHVQEFTDYDDSVRNCSTASMNRRKFLWIVCPGKRVNCSGHFMAQLPLLFPDSKITRMGDFLFFLPLLFYIKMIPIS